ncbi:pirin family protein [Agarivorans sp. QJM3NY_29]|uniref:pirin family protein n=1 Tax=unclassified Agarivorans TaxID=2636026 RepID=UPI003D7D7564
MKHRRTVIKRVTGQATQDGAGVKLTRILGSQQLSMLDPFLMLDCFESDQPDDYLAGFPEHPHRGFQTVSYILNGKMRHKDSVGNEGVIEAGGVQWMSAGRGVIHSEMPEQQDGLLKGFQLWINLPAAQKMSAPSYQEFSAEQIPQSRDLQGNLIRVIAGELADGTQGPVQVVHQTATYLDISMVAGGQLQLDLVQSQQAFIYVIEGQLQVADDPEPLNAYQLAVLDFGEALQLSSHSACRLLLVGAEPLNEPVAWGGPFVMNSREEVLQAFDDFQNNRF